MPSLFLAALILSLTTLCGSTYCYSEQMGPEQLGSEQIHNDAPLTANQTNGIYWGFNIEAMGIESTKAQAQGVGTSAVSIGGEFSRISNNYFRFGAGLSYIIMDDKRGFSQTVEGAGLFNNGDISRESSDVDGFSTNLEAGAFYPLTGDRKITAGLNVGYRYFSIERAISNCTNCRSEDIDLGSGLYFEPNINAQINANMIASLAYSSYSDSEKSFEDAISLRFRFGY